MNKEKLCEMLSRMNAGETERTLKSVHSLIGPVSGVENVLKMVAEKNISPEEGVQLIDALCENARQAESSAPQESVKKRSTAVGVFGMLIIVLSGLCLLHTVVGLASVFRAVRMASTSGYNVIFDPFRTTLFSGLAAILNVFSIVCGVHILRLRNWARKGVLIISLFIIFVATPLQSGSVFVNLARMGWHFPDVVALMFFLVWHIILVIFFMRPSVRRQFVDLPNDNGVSSDGVKRLRRSETSRVIGGVCGGLAEHLGVDPLLFRLGFVVFTLLAGSGILVYLICWIFIPSARRD